MQQEEAKEAPKTVSVSINQEEWAELLRCIARLDVPTPQGKPSVITLYEPWPYLVATPKPKSPAALRDIAARYYVYNALLLLHH